MAGKKEYTIPFSGLKEGIHEYSWDISGAFFEDREYGEIIDGDLHVEATMTKHTRMLVFDFDLKGTVEVTCDICTEPFDYPVDTEQQLIIKLGDKFEEESEDVIRIPETESEVDLSQFIFEYIVTSLPIRRTHEEGQCDPEMISKLEELRTNQDKKGPEDIDPRWDKLKDLN